MLTQTKLYSVFIYMQLANWDHIKMVEKGLFVDVPFRYMIYGSQLESPYVA